MKIAFLKVVSVCLFLILLTAYSSNPSGNKLGNIAPDFIIENSAEEMNLQAKRGGYVLLTFWKSVDAESRIANMKYDRIARELREVEYVAVNFDRSYNVYCEIIEKDELDKNSQYYNGVEDFSHLYSEYALTKGMKTVLLDKTGVIIAENPTFQDLKRLVK